MNAKDCRIGVDRCNDQTRYEHLNPPLSRYIYYFTATKYCHEETDIEKGWFENIS